MDNYTKRFVAYAVMIVGIAWAIAFAIVFKHSAPSSPSENSNSDYTYCVEHGGSYIENGIGEGFTCTLPTPAPKTS